MMKLTLHQLHVFQTVAEAGSVTAAANQLHMTQPGVSNIMRQLEEHYDCQLTHMLGRQLQLSQFGEILLNGCKKIGIELANIRTDLERLKGCVAGTLKVATVSTAKYFVPHLLGEFKSYHPDVHIQLVVKNREQIIERLQNNADDFVVMSHPPRELAVDIADLYEDELVIAASSQYQTPSNETLSLKHFKEAPWIIREQGSGTRFATENAFQKYKFYPKVGMEISDSEAVKQALIANIGISVISRQSINKELQDASLKILPVKGFPIKHEWYLVKNRSVKLSPIAESLYEFANRHQPVFSNFE